ncbi:MAG TPA: archease [Candidatus Nanoarchaeia archaeon]|nr:archease [Candidatus Nanoarchaeia archaeon]
MKFEFFKHTADVMFKAYGKDLGECFSNAGIAFFEVITDTNSVKPLISKSFSINSEDAKSLLYDFLEELLYLHETEHMVFSKFKVSIKDNSLSAVVYGEKINKSHELRSMVKAVTYSNMVIDKKFVQVVLDL